MRTSEKNPLRATYEIRTTSQRTSVRNPPLLEKFFFFLAKKNFFGLKMAKKNFFGKKMAKKNFFGPKKFFGLKMA